MFRQGHKVGHIVLTHRWFTFMHTRTREHVATHEGKEQTEIYASLELFLICTRARCAQSSAAAELLVAARVDCGQAIVEEKSCEQH